MLFIPHARALVALSLCFCLLLCTASGFSLKRRLGSSTSLQAKLSQTGKEAVAAAAARFTNNKVRVFPAASEAEKRFELLAKSIGDEKAASEIAQIFPDIFFVENKRLSENLELLVLNWGKEKTTEVLLRNPNILSVATRGYGSLEASLSKGGGGDMVGASYVVAATRPVGKILLGLLGAALLKAIIFGVEV